MFDVEKTFHGSFVAQTSSRIRQPIGWAQKALPTRGFGIISDGGAALASLLAVHVALWSLWISLLHPSRATRCAAPAPWMRPGAVDDEFVRIDDVAVNSVDAAPADVRWQKETKRARSSMLFAQKTLFDPAWCAVGRSTKPG